MTNTNTRPTGEAKLKLEIETLRECRKRFEEDVAQLNEEAAQLNEAKNMALDQVVELERDKHVLEMVIGRIEGGLDCLGQICDLEAKVARLEVERADEAAATAQAVSAARQLHCQLEAAQAQLARWDRWSAGNPAMVRWRE